jgi:hypothetical protein
LNTETLGARQAGCGDGSGDPLLPTFYTHARTRQGWRTATRKEDGLAAAVSVPVQTERNGTPTDERAGSGSGGGGATS